MKILDWLQLLFIALKLTNQIDWPWVQVLTPLWIVICVAFIREFCE